MTYVAGRPIETLENAGSDERDRVTALIFDLVLDELFRFGLMQTDPNFANYRYQDDTGRIVLLDFGATRAVPPETAKAYRRLLSAGLAGDREGVRTAALEAGFIGPTLVMRHRTQLDRIIDVVLTELERSPPFDFADRRFLGVIREQAASVGSDRAAWHIPPADTLFVQRKISGMALLAARLGAHVDIRAKVAVHMSKHLG